METEIMPSQTGVFTTTGPDVLMSKKGGGRLMMLGLPFVLAGLFVAQIPLGIIPVEVEGGPIILAIILPLGPLFAGVGFALMLSRSGLILDRKTNSVTQWWGLVVPMKKREFNLDHFLKIRVGFREGDRNSADTFSISLVGANPNSTLHVLDFTSYEMAVKAADELASFIDKPIEDLANNYLSTDPL
jgi:hypothetical protein